MGHRTPNILADFISAGGSTLFSGVLPVRLHVEENLISIDFLPHTNGGGTGRINSA